jgi:hypothetical protein
MTTEQQTKFDRIIHVNVRLPAEHMCRNGNERMLITLRAFNGSNIGRGLLLWETMRTIDN